MRFPFRSARQIWIFFLAFIGIFLAANAPAQNISIPVVSEELVLKAQLEGTVRVIVHIKESFQPEGKLKNFGAVASQREGIATAQELLLKEMNNTRHRIFRRFETIPFVAIEAGTHAGCIRAVAAVRSRPTGPAHS